MYRPVNRLSTPQNQIINLPLGLGTIEIIGRNNQPQNIITKSITKTSWQQTIEESLREIEIAIEENNGKGTKGKILAPGSGLKPAPRTGLEGPPESTLDPALPGTDPIIYPPGGWEPFPQEFNNCRKTIYLKSAYSAIRCYWSFNSSGRTWPYGPYSGPMTNLEPSTSPFVYTSGSIAAQQYFYPEGYTGDGIPQEFRVQDNFFYVILPEGQRATVFWEVASNWKFNPRQGYQLVAKPPPATPEYNPCNDYSFVPYSGKIAPIIITGYSMSCPFAITNPPTIEDLNTPKWPSNIQDPGFPPNWLDSPEDDMSCGCDCRQIADILARQNAKMNSAHNGTRDKVTTDIQKLGEFTQQQILQTMSPPDLSPILQELRSIKEDIQKGCDLTPILQRLNEVEAFLWTGNKTNA